MLAQVLPDAIYIHEIITAPGGGFAIRFGYTVTASDVAIFALVVAITLSMWATFFVFMSSRN